VCLPQCRYQNCRWHPTYSSIVVVTIAAMFDNVVFVTPATVITHSTLIEDDMDDDDIDADDNDDDDDDQDTTMVVLVRFLSL